MSEQLHLSSPAWALLDMLQQQLGVAIEVLDPSLKLLTPAGVADQAAAARDAAVVAELHKSLRTGELRIDRSSGAAVGIIPLRAARQIAGCLVITQRPPRSGERAGAPVDVEIAGHLARTALEADLVTTSQLADARHRARRVHGILRFLTQLGGTDIRDVMNAVIQAGTVWFDLDCRIYERQADGAYRLAAALPGVEARLTGTRIEAPRAERLLASRRFASGGDLDDLLAGMAGRPQELLVLPVGSEPSRDWLMVLAGAIDQEVELTFTAIARILAGELLARDVARLEKWRAALAGLTASADAVPERVLLSMLDALAGKVDSPTARLTLRAGDQERVLAAIGPLQAPADEEPGRSQRQFTLAIDADSLVTLMLAAPDAGDGGVAAHASTWLKALQPWLPDAIRHLTQRERLFEVRAEEPPFERRIQEEVERAKRFNLGLGLVLIGPLEGAGSADIDPLLSAIRAELRASDLIGRIRDGLVAVLLVHAEPVGTDSVISRLRRRFRPSEDEGRMVRVAQVGRAVFSPDCQSADALIAQALREVQRFESRN